MRNDLDYPDVPTTQYDLIDNNNAEDLRLRIINTVSGVSVMVVVLEELDDSFLVALPSKLMQIEGSNSMKVDPYMRVRFFRVFKSTIVTLVPCFDDFEVYYIRYLLDEGVRLYPEVIEDMIPKLEERFEEIKAFYRPEEPQQDENPEQEPDLEGIDSTLIVRNPIKYRQ